MYHEFLALHNEGALKLNSTKNIYNSPNHVSNKKQTISFEQHLRSCLSSGWQKRSSSKVERS